MKASVGDRIVIVPNELDRPVRDGKIVAARELYDSSPYVVRWADTGRHGYFFLGPSAGEEHVLKDDDTVENARPPHIRRWAVTVDVFETDDHTSARAVLSAESPRQVEGTGRFNHHDGGSAVPEIDAEVAAARALHSLADQLLGIASDDIGGVEGRRRTSHSSCCVG